MIVNTPSKDKKSLEKGEKKHIEEYADKFGSLLINKRSVPKVKKKEKKKEKYNIKWILRKNLIRELLC